MHRIGSCPSGSYISNEETLDRTYHFKWRSIRNLLYLTFTYSSHPVFFHMFNYKIDDPVTLLHYTVTSIFIGMTYMCVELFIRQYTRRLDWDQNLCPILKDMTVSLILQNTLFCLLSLRYGGDSARYLASSFVSTPIWSICLQNTNSSICMASRDVVKHCETPGRTELLKLNITSVHMFYTEFMKSNVRGAWTWRFFVSAVIWILNFCLMTIADNVALKMFKHIGYLKHSCTIVTFTYLAVSSRYTREAFFQLMNINSNYSISDSVVSVALVYGVGMVGIYDFGSTSPFTMMDNALVIYTILFILLSAMRSMIVNILLLELSNCVDIRSASVGFHYMFFVLMPLATEFLYAQKLINISLYLYVLLSLLPGLMLYTLTVTRLLHSEYPTIKFIYIQGLICQFGFCFSVPLLLVDQYFDNIRYGLIEGLSITLLYLGGIRMSIIMWVYGIKKFSTDINFWLGFSPTKFWTVSWSVLPALLLISSGYRFYNISYFDNMVVKTSAYVWFLMSALIAFGLKTRTIVRYAMQNNLMGAFRSNKKYGPPEKQDRKRRWRYDATIDQRQCFHECVSVDEHIDCNHWPLMNTGERLESLTSSDTLTQMYEGIPPREESAINYSNVRTNAKEKKN